MLIVTYGQELYVITWRGDVLEPEHDVTAISSGRQLFASPPRRAP